MAGAGNGKKSHIAMVDDEPKTFFSFYVDKIFIFVFSLRR